MVDNTFVYNGILPYFLKFIYIYISACADAYLTPQIKKYVAGFASGFKDNIQVRFFFFHYLNDFPFAVIGRRSEHRNMPPSPLSAMPKMADLSLRVYGFVRFVDWF